MTASQSPPPPYSAASPAPPPRPVQLDRQCQGEPGAGHADGVVKGDGAAVGVETFHWDAQVAGRRHNNHRERLVDFDHVQVGQRQVTTPDCIGKSAGRVGSAMAVTGTKLGPNDALPCRVQVGSWFVEHKDLVGVADHGLRYGQCLGDARTGKAKGSGWSGRGVASDSEHLDLRNWLQRVTGGGPLCRVQFKAPPRGHCFEKALDVAVAPLVKLVAPAAGLVTNGDVLHGRSGHPWSALRRQVATLAPPSVEFTRLGVKCPLQCEVGDSFPSLLAAGVVIPAGEHLVG
jgi:hypothetical protein